ncbi:MAG: type I 3-dehydroquinate dehydratase [Acidobacteria bacterium]|jgi:3-dehydroquinate dehydratase type I|nr:type I 3-dehydroquinate dehydratase [Acidobacteriota bacterium]
MICVSIAYLSFEQCREILKDIEMAELRLERLNFSLQQVREIFSMHPQLIATCRRGTMNDEERKELLLTAVEAGAAFVDIEIDSEQWLKIVISEACRIHKCKVIMSYHNYKRTPSRQVLEEIIESCFAAGVDIAKISCQSLSHADTARILSLYDREEVNYENKKIIAVAMGEIGKISRLAALLLGAPFTYASLSQGKETAPGQLSKQSLLEILRWMDK